MNIIVVDDEYLALSLLVGTIREVVTDAVIHSFSSPADALSFVRENGCDVAFLDIRMRDITGLELAKQIKDLCGGANIIFVTAYPDYSMEAFRLYASDYLLKPAKAEDVREAMLHLRNPIRHGKQKKIRFQCFGNFEVFVGQQPLAFHRAKAKELLAYLVDRKGAGVTMRELMAVLWEDGPDNASRQSNLRNLISETKKALREVGADGIIRKGWNTISIDCDMVDCDYYDFLRHIPDAVNRYHGEYMMQYSWAEFTTAELSDD